MDSIHAEPDETLLVSAAVLGQVHIESRCESHRQAVQTPEQLPQPTHSCHSPLTCHPLGAALRAQAAT